MSKFLKDVLSKIKGCKPSLETTKHVVDIISNWAPVVCKSPVVQAVCKTVGTILVAQQPDMVDQLAKVEHNLSRTEGKMDQLKDVVDVMHSQLSAVSKYVKEQEKKEMVVDVSNVLLATINSMEKFKSGDTMEIAKGVLDIISSAGQLIFKPYAPVIAIGIVFGVIGTILTKGSKPQPDQTPSVVEQLANIVHDEMVHFNKRLQDQKYNGLKRRVADQQCQLQTMKRGEKLDDPNLWNDYVQFMGELSDRFESPLPFKYEANKTSLTSDPDVADFVTAVVTYCEAYCCFMALLVAAKGKFAGLGRARKEDEIAVNRKISCQIKDAKEKLSFLAEEKYLTFLGRLPYEGGKLTKIVALSRNMRGKSLVEAVRGSLGLPGMQDSAAVEEAATKVARQSVKVKADRHPLPQPQGNWLSSLFSGTEFLVQFINETTFPMKIVSARVGSGGSIPELVKDVQPRASVLSKYEDFVPGGYIIIYQNGILSSSTEPPAGQARVIEFAYLLNPVLPPEIIIQDKTSDEFTHGKDTFNKMTVMMMKKSGSKQDKTQYWFENGLHFMARGEVIDLSHALVWRFVVQDYDPCSVQDIIQG